MRSKRIIAMLLVCILSVGLIIVPVSADSLFVDNPHWSEVSAQTLTRLYNNGSSFVAMFFRQSCFNSNLRKVMLSNWMTEYDLDIYGVDVDAYNMPSWAWAEIKTDSVTLPVICIVENGKVDCFTAEDSMRSIQKRLQEYLGFYNESEIDFSKLNEQTYSNYSTRASTAKALYCMPLDDVPAEIRSETERVISDAATDREKVKAIYDWVTTNIYYNYGMLNGTVERRTSAVETYAFKNSICVGYANLTAAMCHAAGIPCRVVTGFAAGVDTQSTVVDVWTQYEAYLGSHDLDVFARNMAEYENHAWNEAYVDGEWIILDTTWGSNNDYYPDAQGKISGTPTDAYFDPDLEWLSETHLFWTDYSSDFAIEVRNGILTVTGALEPEDVTSANLCLIASFDSNGKMQECAPVELSEEAVSHVLMNSSNAVVVKMLLVGEKYMPTAKPYFGKVAR